MVDDMEQLPQAIHEKYILPEIDNRWGGLDNLPDGFKIRECIILVPIGSDPIVRFNREIGWEAELQVSSDKLLNEGDIIYMHEVVKVKLTACHFS